MVVDLKKYIQERRAKLKAKGLCQGCGQQQPFENRTLCGWCLIERRVAERARVERLKQTKVG